MHAPLRWLIVLYASAVCCMVCSPLWGQQQQRLSGVERVANARAERPGPQVPFRLSPSEVEYRDRVLMFWEKNSAEVQTFSCRFTRWEYDAAFGGPNWEKQARSIGHGVLNFKSPDKGEYHVEKLEFLVQGGANGGRPLYKEQPGQFGEHWICDGQKVIEYVPQRKVLIERQLPPEMQGAAISEGPLPFMFGAKADKLNARYWIRPLAAPATKDAKGNLVQSDEIWLEAVPKRREDAANYKALRVILSKQDFLPQGLVMFMPNGKSRTTFHFHQRVVNRADILDWLQRDFFNPKTPKGWQRVVENLTPAAGPAVERLGREPQQGTAPR